MPNFEVLDARIASALNKIIHNSHFKRKISLEEQKAQKEDRFSLYAQCLLPLSVSVCRRVFIAFHCILLFLSESPCPSIHVSSIPVPENPVRVRVAVRFVLCVGTTKRRGTRGGDEGKQRFACDETKYIVFQKCRDSSRMSIGTEIWKQGREGSARVGRTSGRKTCRGQGVEGREQWERNPHGREKRREEGGQFCTRHSVPIYAEVYFPVKCPVMVV